MNTYGGSPPPRRDGRVPDVLLALVALLFMFLFSLLVMFATEGGFL